MDPTDDRPVGFGCMRLSTTSDADDDDGAATIAAALDAGATLLDTAGAYGPESSPHANERLVARVLAGRADRSSITVVSKGGLTRVGDRYAPDGRASTLRAECEASVAALGGPIDLYLLHAIDPRTSLETSVRALESLRRTGLVRAIGVSNVSRAELDRACATAQLAAVEVALSPFDDEAIRGGVVARCAELGLLLLAHSPFGGPKRAARLAKDSTLVTIGARRGVEALAVVVAWLRDLAPSIVPIPGARTARHAKVVVEALRVALDGADRAELDARFPAGALLRTPPAERRPRDDASGEVHIVMGIPGAGKSTLARELAARGHERLNRDELGGTLRGLLPRLERALASGRRSVVLDNTYPTRASRNEVIEVAWRHGVPVRCTWLDTPLEVAQANVARRMVEARGRLLEPAELQVASREDASIVPPRALFRFRRELEPPSSDEGFASVDVVPFRRRPRACLDRDTLIVALDVLASPAVAALRARAELVGVIGWTPGRQPTIDGIDVRTCAHPAGPPVCWCRPPLPGLAVALVEAHQIDPERCTVVGPRTHYEPIARAIGAKFEHA